MKLPHLPIPCANATAGITTSMYSQKLTFLILNTIYAVIIPAIRPPCIASPPVLILIISANESKFLNSNAT